MFDSFVSWGAPIVGMPEDMFRYLVAFFVEIPITLLCRYVPDNQKLKHFLFGFLGMIIAYFVYSTISFSVFISMIPVYFIMKYMPNRKGAYLSFAISVGYLIFLHVKRMVDNYMGYTLDFSGLQMVLTIKFTTFAFSVSNANDEEYKCSPYTEKHKIKKYPSLLEFFGYTFFFPAYFSGPSLEYNDYISFIDMSMFDDFGKRAIPPIPVKRTVTLIIEMFVLLGLFLLIGYFDLYTTLEYYILDHFELTGVFLRLTLVIIYVELAKVKYYFTWKFAELLSLFLGFGYTGMNKETGETEWNGFVNVNIYKMEISDSVRQIVANWNIQTEKWLRYYIHERVAQIPALKAYKNLITNMMSAFWHGFYPGYYIAFACLTLQQKFQYVLHTQLRPLLTEKYGEKSTAMKCYKIFNYLYTPYGMLYSFAAFVLLSFKNVWTLYKGTYFIPHIFAAVVYLVLSNFPIYKRKKVEKKEVKEEVNPEKNENVKTVEEKKQD